VHVRGRTAAKGCAALAFAILSLTGCGEDSGGQEAEGTPSPASPSASNGAPDCAAVWQDGSELARPYDGCNSDGGFVATDALECSSGQRMVRYGDHFYAALGGTINETESSLEDDRRYRRALASCRA
jgi:hypothetical protein